MRVKKKTLLWIAIGVLAVLTLWMTFKTGTVSTGTAKTAGVAVKAAASSGMVGGC